MTIIHTDTDFAPSAFADSVIDHRSAREHYEREIERDVERINAENARTHDIVERLLAYALIALIAFGAGGGFA